MLHRRGTLKFITAETDRELEFHGIIRHPVWKHPLEPDPLILHPFNENVPPSTLLENSRAALKLSGLIPIEDADPDLLMQCLLAGRYSEIRMLFFLGKDLLRWIEQCVESVARFPELVAARVVAQSFADLLLAGAPSEVSTKMMSWGVADYPSIFARALGLNTIFVRPPDPEFLAPEFLRHYHHYADFLFRCFMQLQPYCSISSANFDFELYASGEFSRRLESEWGEPEG